MKEHPFFKDVDWKQVYLLKLTPPLIPPRGEVNAADAFDIGNFDEDDTKGIKVNSFLLRLRTARRSFVSPSVDRSRSRIVQKFPHCHFRTLATGNHRYIVLLFSFASTHDGIRFRNGF